MLLFFIAKIPSALLLRVSNAPWLPRFEGAGKLPILGNLTEGVLFE